MYDFSDITAEFYFAAKNRMSVAAQSFSGVSIEGGSLQGADLWALELTDSMFEDVNFNEAKFSSAILDYVCFRNCDLSGVEFSGVHGSHLVFIGCKLEEAQFKGSVLEDCLFSDCEGNPDFSSAGLNDSKFLNSDLMYSDFGGADLTDAEFAGGSISGAEVTRHTIVARLKLCNQVNITDVELASALSADTVQYEDVIVEPYGDIVAPKIKVPVLGGYRQHLGEALPDKTHLPVTIRPSKQTFGKVNYSIYTGVDHRAHLYCSDLEEFKSNQ